MAANGIEISTTNELASNLMTISLRKASMNAAASKLADEHFSLMERGSGSQQSCRKKSSARQRDPCLRGNMFAPDRPKRIVDEMKEIAVCHINCGEPEIDAHRR